MNNGKSQGISRNAYTLEIEYNLRHKEYSTETLRWLVGRCADHYLIPSPQLTYGRAAKRRRGFHRGDHLTGFSEIVLNSEGLNLGTTLHEFTHHLGFRLGYEGRRIIASGHGADFKDLHLQVLEAFLDDEIMDAWDDVDYIERANEHWNRMPLAYERTWTEGISTRELVTALDGMVKAV